MLVPFGIILGEGVILYLLSQQVSKYIYLFWLLITRSRRVAISLLTASIFPGTVIHELAHMFTAEIMGVPTAKLTLDPGLPDENGYVRSGSVAIAQTDPLRRTLIGIAPVFWGIAALAVISYYFSGVMLSLESALPLLGTPDADYRPLVIALFMLYGTFAVSNAMFSSHEDMNGAWPLLILITLIVIALAVMGVRLVLPPAVTSFALALLWSLSQTLGWVVGLNLIILLVMSFGVMLLSRSIRRPLRIT